MEGLTHINQMQNRNIQVKMILTESSLSLLQCDPGLLALMTYSICASSFLIKLICYAFDTNWFQCLHTVFREYSFSCNTKWWTDFRKWNLVLLTLLRALFRFQFGNQWKQRGCWSASLFLTLSTRHAFPFEVLRKRTQGHAWAPSRIKSTPFCITWNMTFLNDFLKKFKIWLNFRRDASNSKPISAKEWELNSFRFFPYEGRDTTVIRWYYSPHLKGSY